jgi:hypothetical protein
MVTSYGVAQPRSPALPRRGWRSGHVSRATVTRIIFKRRSNPLPREIFYLPMDILCVPSTNRGDQCKSGCADLRRRGSLNLIRAGYCTMGIIFSEPDRASLSAIHSQISYDNMITYLYQSCGAILQLQFDYRN